ncbi:unnamed protein product [Symbiodinium sp. KB8]|nr:unnamed protein product [Symbiodinium sp. KB8]
METTGKEKEDLDLKWQKFQQELRSKAIRQDMDVYEEAIAELNQLLQSPDKDKGGGASASWEQSRTPPMEKTSPPPTGRRSEVSYAGGDGLEEATAQTVEETTEESEGDECIAELEKEQAPPWAFSVRKEFQIFGIMDVLEKGGCMEELGMWVATPFYEVDVIDVETNTKVLVLDCRPIGGTAFAAYFESPINRDTVMKPVDNYHPYDIELYIYGSQDAAAEGQTFEAVTGLCSLLEATQLMTIAVYVFNTEVLTLYLAPSDEESSSGDSMSLDDIGMIRALREQVALAAGLLWLMQMQSQLPERGQLDMVINEFPNIHVEYKHVKGHSGDPWNEYADSIAKQAARGELTEVGTPSETCRTFLTASLDVNTVHQGPRMMAVTASVAQEKIALISAHCPHAARAKERDEYLQELAAVLNRVKKTSMVFVGTDLYGRLPTNYQPATEDLEFDEPDSTGRMIANITVDNGLWAPSTFIRYDVNSFHTPARHWGAKPDGNFLDIACKQNLLYQVNAAAIKYATQHIKKKIAVAKAGFLDAIAANQSSDRFLYSYTPKMEGILYGAFKGSGAQEVAESHRSLYISSFASKVLHKALRQKVDSQVPITDDRTVEELSYRFGLDATDIVEFKEVILKGSMMAKAGVPGPIQQATGDFHYKTLFPDMPTGTDSVSPERARAQANDAQEDAWDSTWADDTAYPILADSADELLKRSMIKASVIMHVAAAAAEAGQHKGGIFSSGQPEIWWEDLREAMPVVKSYKHLGGYLDARAGGKAEVRYRLSMAAVAFGAARGLILQNRSIPLPTFLVIVVMESFVEVSHEVEKPLRTLSILRLSFLQ